MYNVTVRADFDAAHYLRGYHGRCENMHGHRYEVAATVTGEKGDDGMVCDFSLLKAALRGILGEFDHQCLNDLLAFSSDNPSAENIAKTVYDRLATLLESGVSLVAVTVWESPDSWVEYRPQG